MAIRMIRPQDRDIQPVANPPAGADPEVVKRSGKQIVSMEDPYVQFTKVVAGTKLPAHSHSASEALIILEGAVEVDGDRCGPGTVFLIPASEEYGLDVAEGDDLVFVVVRPSEGPFQAARGN
jgi:quercetin dioxygenase-like cupin family protein